MKTASITPLIFSLSVITIFGLTTILSIFPDLFSNQLTFFFTGLFLLILVSRVHSKTIQETSFILYIFCVLLLLFTLLLGRATRGSVRWIDLGIFRLQPSEISKPILIAFFANRFIKPIGGNPMVWLIKNLAYLAVPAFLVLIQPDLGSTLVIVITWIGMLLASRFPKKIILAFSILSVLLLPLGYQFLHDYQKTRLHTFISPFSDPTGSGYNVIQAMIAVGSGKFIGKGVRQGTQSHLRFLPERHTDFAFASFAEEFGFVGVSILLSAFLIFFFWLASLIQHMEPFGKLLVTGVFWLFFIQTFINVGMNMGVLPVTGITLPFISYGGSSILSSAIAIGMVLSLRKTRRMGD